MPSLTPIRVPLEITPTDFFSLKNWYDNVCVPVPHAVTAAVIVSRHHDKTRAVPNSQMRSWCRQSLEGRVTRREHYSMASVYFFEKESDAIIFAFNWSSP